MYNDSETQLPARALNRNHTSIVSRLAPTPQKIELNIEISLHVQYLIHAPIN